MQQPATRPVVLPSSLPLGRWQGGLTPLTAVRTGDLNTDVSGDLLTPLTAVRTDHQGRRQEETQTEEGILLRDGSEN